MAAPEFLTVAERFNRWRSNQVRISPKVLLMYFVGRLRLSQAYSACLASSVHLGPIICVWYGENDGRWIKIWAAHFAVFIFEYLALFLSHSVTSR